MIWLLLACAGGKDADTADGPGEALVGRTVPLEDAEASFTAGASSAVGSALAFGGDDAEGRAAVLVAAQFASRVCAWTAPPAGLNTMDEADACWTGESAQDYAGYAIGGRGDLDGDGVAELAIGAVANGAAGNKAGAAYVVRGPIAPGEHALADADARLLGEASGDYAGALASFVGDMDGDGDDELLVGAFGNRRGGGGAGAVYLFHALPVSGSLATADVVIVGTGPATTVATPPPPHGAPSEGDGVGAVASGAGDMDGDGLADIVLSANGNDLGGMDAGAVAVFHGPLADGVHAFADGDALWLGDEAEQYFGDQVAPAGDLDGDGLDDVLAVHQGPSPGVIVVLPGSLHATRSARVAELPIRLVGVALEDQTGASADGAGDVDGDGWRDVLVGAYGSDAGVPDAGAAYVVHGPFAAGTRDLATADLRWLGAAEGDHLGRAVAGGGDADGDGLDDVLLGALYADVGGAFSGQAWLFTGLTR